jgi:betaine reductase
LETKRIVVYLNQFFGQMGGEDKANVPPQSFDQPRGPGVGLQQLLPDNCKVVGTIVCGDGYFNENLEEASAQVREMLTELQPDVVIAGPAFNAGRYGMACGMVGKIASEMDIPAVSAMYPENPGVESYRQYLYIIETTDSAAGMRTALPAVAKLAGKLANNEPIGSPAEEGYLSRGIRRNVFMEKRGSERAIDMLLKKLRGEEFETEYPIPHFDRVEPAAALTDLSTVTVALVTSGGIVPKGNPDRIEASSASRYGKYSIEGLDGLSSTAFETAHGGYDPTYANQSPDRVVPVDALRALEKEGRIGKLHPFFYSTVGNGTSVANAKKYATEIAAELVNEGVQAVILTST